MVMSGRINVVFAWLAIAAFIAVEAKPPSAIRGGQTAAAGEFPYVVSISRRGVRNWCGGAIISPQHIITAGHCITGGGNITVLSGVEDLENGKPVVSVVKRVVPHPNYSAQTLLRPVRNDIAILVLEKPLTFSERIKKIELPAGQPDENNENNVVAGWGAIRPAQFSDQMILQKTSIKLLNDVKCLEKSHFVDRPEKLCGYQDGSALCVGDSGSALVSGNKIIGVVSASSCTLGVAHSYTNVYNYLDWINTVLASPSS